MHHLHIGIDSVISGNNIPTTIIVKTAWWKTGTSHIRTRGLVTPFKDFGIVPTISIMKVIGVWVGGLPPHFSSCTILSNSHIWHPGQYIPSPNYIWDSYPSYNIAVSVILQYPLACTRGMCYIMTSSNISKICSLTSSTSEQGSGECWSISLSLRQRKLFLPGWAIVTSHAHN